MLLLATLTTWPPWSKIMQRVLVVPWSRAAAYLAISYLSLNQPG